MNHRYGNDGPYPENANFAKDMPPWEHELDQAMRQDRINRWWTRAYRVLATVGVLALVVIALKL